uniref:Uncharacterized protein n=1 Tax=Trichogramma kaykai TaxID=54128 RepID=A0ABD2VV51_9HYME
MTHDVCNRICTKTELICTKADLRLKKKKQSSLNYSTSRRATPNSPQSALCSLQNKGQVTSESRDFSLNSLTETESIGSTALAGALFHLIEDSYFSTLIFPRNLARQSGVNILYS